ncbi:MAG: single-stranded DNA-binding protein [Cytophagales bacterium]
MKGFNKVILIGHLGNAPEIRTLNDGTKVAHFSLAINEYFKDSKGELQTSTDWHNIVAWKGIAEIAEKLLTKGSQVMVEGKLKNRSFEDKEGIKRYVTEVVAEQLVLLDKK